MNIAELLPSLDFCAEMTQAECAILAPLATLELYEPKSIIFRSGEPAQACYLVLDGHVSLEICAAGVGCRRIISVGKGELVGWSPFLSDACFTATARTLEPTRLIRIDAERLRLACDQNHEFGYQILRKVVKALSNRINAARLQLLDMFGPEPDTPTTMYAKAPPATSAAAMKTVATETEGEPHGNV